MQSRLGTGRAESVVMRHVSIASESGAGQPADQGGTTQHHSTTATGTNAALDRAPEMRGHELKR